MQQGASWNFFFLLLRARFIYLAVEWVLLGDVPGLLLSLVMQWARCGKGTHILSLIEFKFNGTGTMVYTWNSTPGWGRRIKILIQPGLHSKLNVQPEIHRALVLKQMETTDNYTN